MDLARKYVDHLQITFLGEIWEGHPTEHEPMEKG